MTFCKPTFNATTAAADGHKIARDLEDFRRHVNGTQGHSERTTSRFSSQHAGFPGHSDGTVDVIIRFNQKPKSRHFQDIVAHGGRLKLRLHHINGAAYRIPVKMLDWLEKHPDVAYVSPDRRNKVAFDDAIPAVMADLARQQYGLDGSGIGIAVIDSGVYNHDDLQRADNSGSRIVYSESFVPGDASANDAYGHGTHVAGIIAGNGHDSQSGYSQQYTGLAPNANIINLRVLDANGAGADSQVIAAIQRAVELKDTYNIRVINLSLGRNVYESYTMDPLCQAVETAWQAGIVVVTAAGNSGRDNSAGTGGYGTILAPGNDPSVITVGATKTNGTPDRADDMVASYSSKGPTLLDHVVKPDAAALMIQQDPTLTPDTIKARMMKTAWKGYPTTSLAFDMTGLEFLSQYDIFTIGAGYLDVDSALGNTDVANGSATSPTAVYDSTTGQATLVWGASVVWSDSVVWDGSIVWEASIDSDGSLWGNSVVWGNTGIVGNSIIWAESIIWENGIVGDDPVDPVNDLVGILSTGEDGEN